MSLKVVSHVPFLIFKTKKYLNAHNYHSCIDKHA